MPLTRIYYVPSRHKLHILFALPAHTSMRVYYYIGIFAGEYAVKMHIPGNYPAIFMYTYGIKYALSMYVYGVLGVSPNKLHFVLQMRILPMTLRVIGCPRRGHIMVLWFYGFMVLIVLSFYNSIK